MPLSIDEYAYIINKCLGIIMDMEMVFISLGVFMMEIVFRSLGIFMEWKWFSEASGSSWKWKWK